MKISKLQFKAQSSRRARLSRSVGLILMALLVVPVFNYAASTKTPPTTTPAPVIQNSKSDGTDAFSLVAKEPDRPFEYDPVDPEFWGEVRHDIETKNYPRIIDLAVDVLKGKNKKSEELAEANLAIAIALENLGFKFGASLYFMDIARKNLGSQMAQASLAHLSVITQDKEFDPEDLVEDFLTNNEFGPLHGEIQSFVSYHTALYNLAYGFQKWADAELKKIIPNSFWDFKLQYLTAIGEVARNRLDSAYDRLRKIYRNEKAPVKYQALAQYQLARILFEKAELDKAYKLYTGLENMPIRERGRIILERAWALFYLRDYGKALGLLGALEAPFFRQSISPEQYILKMLIYKTLCHFDSVSSVAEQFNKRYGSALRTIRKRKPLTENPTLVNRALMNGRIQDLANAINDIREERAQLVDYKWDDYPFYRPLLERYVKKDQELQSRLRFLMEPRVREAAEELLDSEEQIAFLDYTSKLDALRIVQKGERRDYESEKVSYLKFDKIFWPVQQEYWTDEFESYEMIIKSRCNEEPRTNINQDDIKKLDEGGNNDSSGLDEGAP